MSPLLLSISAIVLVLAGCAAAPVRTTPADLRQQVVETEKAFAKTMADRDHAAFARFLAPDTVFVSEWGITRGAAAVTDGWKWFFKEPQAPFSWEPEVVEILEGGTLALSTGPVYNPQGERTATFISIWRMESSGEWRIIADQGCRWAGPKP